MDQAYIVYSSPFTGLGLLLSSMSSKSRQQGLKGHDYSSRLDTNFLEMACTIFSKTPNLSFLFNNLLFQCVTSNIYPFVVL